MSERCPQCETKLIKVMCVMCGYNLSLEPAPPAPPAAPLLDNSARTVLEYLHNVLLPESEKQPLVTTIVEMKRRLACAESELEQVKVDRDQLRAVVISLINRIRKLPKRFPTKLEWPEVKDAEAAVSEKGSKP